MDRMERLIVLVFLMALYLLIYKPELFKIVLFYIFGKKNISDKQKSNEVLKKEELLFEPKLDFTKKCKIQINWLKNPEEVFASMSDCSGDDVLSGPFDVFVVGLYGEKIPDKSSLLYYRSEYRTQIGEICNKDKSIICHTGMYSIECCHKCGELEWNDCKCEYDEDFDTIISIDFNKLKYDKLLFLIGRPKTDTPNHDNWIDENRVFKDEINAVSYVDCYINDSLIIQNINFHFNLNGAMTLFEIVKTNNKWKVNVNHNKFKQGLKDIIWRYADHL